LLEGVLLLPVKPDSEQLTGPRKANKSEVRTKGGLPEDIGYGNLFMLKLPQKSDVTVTSDH
jgi:hypothetical protein